MSCSFLFQAWSQQCSLHLHLPLEAREWCLDEKLPGTLPFQKWWKSSCLSAGTESKSQGSLGGPISHCRWRREEPGRIPLFWAKISISRSISSSISISKSISSSISVSLLQSCSGFLPPPASVPIRWAFKVLFLITNELVSFVRCLEMWTQGCCFFFQSPIARVNK